MVRIRNLPSNIFLFEFFDEEICLDYCLIWGWAWCGAWTSGEGILYKKVLEELK